MSCPEMSHLYNFLHLTEEDFSEQPPRVSIGGARFWPETPSCADSMRTTAADTLSDAHGKHAGQGKCSSGLLTIYERDGRMTEVHRG